MDVEEIALGSRWREVLDQRLRAADVVLVLIGHEWRDLKDESGRRRLDDPEDVTRWELETALAQRKRLVPVLLDQSPPLVREELPAALAPLADLQAVRIRHEAFESGLDELIGRLTGKRLRDEVRSARAQLLLERAKRWGVPAIALAVVLLAWTRFFDVLTLDTRFATWTLALADALAPPQLAPDLVLVTLGSEQPSADTDMRARYAALIAALARAGSRKAVLDLYFHVPKASDAVLAQAMRDARAAGMQVFFGFIETENGKPRAVRELALAASATGLACAGRRLGYALSIPIAFDVVRDAERWRVSPLPALALLGAAGDVRVEGISPRSNALRLRNATASLRQPFSMLGNEISGKQACAAILAGTRVAELVVRISPLERLRERRMALDDVLAGRVAAERLAGKTVVIGYETAQESFPVAHGLTRETRFGYELQADALNSLVTGRVMRFAGSGVQTAMAALFAALGAGLGVRMCRRGRGHACLVAGIIVAAYIALAVAVAAAEDVLLMSAYDIGAFVFAYVLFRYLARRWRS
jgi:CHASE2 domain-containing sensor protein